MDFLNDKMNGFQTNALYMSVKRLFSWSWLESMGENIRLRRPNAISHYQDLLTDEIHFYQFHINTNSTNNGTC